MKLTFLGAAGAVTGSCCLLQTSRATLLLERFGVEARRPVLDEVVTLI